jgi:Ca-activated chloride channel homolog
MRVVTRILFVTLGLLAGLVAFEAPRIILPVPIVVSKGESPVQLSSLRVETEVMGSVATSRVTMTFFNPNLRALEGNLEFPLKDGQIIDGFSLESLDGKDMIPASAVEKAKGEQVFEDIERKMPIQLYSLKPRAIISSSVYIR